MPVADPGPAVDELINFVSHCEKYSKDRHTSQGAEHDEALRLKLAMVRAVAKKVDPELLDFFVAGSSPAERWTRACDGAIRLIGHLTDAAEIARIADGPVPSIVASNLQPWVWHAACEFWSAGHHAVAVQQAASALDVQVSAGGPDGELRGTVGRKSSGCAEDRHGAPLDEDDADPLGGADTIAEVTSAQLPTAQRHPHPLNGRGSRLPLACG